MDCFYDSGKGKLYNCNCLDLMKGMDDGTVDCIATDPPYFLINKSGSGFMGKQWESLNTKRAVEILCRSRKFVEYVERFFLSIAVEKNIIGESSVLSNASVNGCPTEEKSESNVPCVERNLTDTKVQSIQNTYSVQGIAITKGEVLALWREMFPNHTTVIENLNENVLFVIPYSLLDAKHIPIVPESVLKFITRAQCEGRTIHLTSTEEAKIKDLIGVLTGTTLDGSYTSGTKESAGCVESNATAKRYNVITLDDTKRAEITHWIISLLYASNATQILKESPSHTLMYHFHVAWLEEVCRILKPGAFAFITYTPRQDSVGILIKACKDAGLETNFTSLFWCYASGFPKASNIGKVIDKRNGEERKGVIRTDGQATRPTTLEFADRPMKRVFEDGEPVTEQAKAMDGSYAGFQPKPALEVIIVAMKPLSEKTYVEQALKNGKGVTWLDNCRIPINKEQETDKRVGTDATWGGKREASKHTVSFPAIEGMQMYKDDGRFPANLLVSDKILDTGRVSKSPNTYTRNAEGKSTGRSSLRGIGEDKGDESFNFGDEGDFSRYFDVDRWFDERVKELPESIRKTYPFLIVPKPSKAEKNLGCEGIIPSDSERTNQNWKCIVCGKFQFSGDGNICKCETPQWERPKNQNNHPTVKSIALMSYLITLGSRKGELIYDPFVGSGTTIIASELLERRWVASELDTKSCEITRARMSAVPQYAELPTLTEVKKMRTRLTQKNLFDYT